MGLQEKQSLLLFHAIIYETLLGVKFRQATFKLICSIVVFFTTQTPYISVVQQKMNTFPHSSTSTKQTRVLSQIAYLCTTEDRY